MCPRCYDNKRKVIRTQRNDGFILRTSICSTCGLEFQSKEKVVNVSVYNAKFMKSDRIPLSKYQDNYINTN